MIYRFNTIGECCREWRRDKNISVSDMAKYIGCCQQNITAFERGENISGRLLLEYVARGLMILGVEDDLYICKDREAIEALGHKLILDKIKEDIHATAEMHEDGDYYLRDKWVNEIFEKYTSRK